MVEINKHILLYKAHEKNTYMYTCTCSIPILLDGLLKDIINVSFDMKTKENLSAIDCDDLRGDVLETNDAQVVTMILLF